MQSGFMGNLSNIKNNLPKIPTHVKVIAIFLLFMTTFVGIYFYLKPPRVDVNERYVERLKLAEDSLNLMEDVDTYYKPYGTLEEQMGEEAYLTYLGIPTESGSNKQVIEDEYREAVEAGMAVQAAVAEHERDIKNKGGLVTAEDLKAIDTLPINDPQRRKVILNNLGANEEDFKRQPKLVLQSTQADNQNEKIQNN